MQQPTLKSKKLGLLDVEISGIKNEDCQEAIEVAIGLLSKKLPPSMQALVKGTEITIADGLIESGGLTKAEDKKIILDATKNTLSLQTAEDFLVEAGYLNKGDWTKALPETKNQEWSCLTYQLIHEFGHLIDGLAGGDSYTRLSQQLSPTKYGSTSSSEAFAEAFAYWVFELDQAPEAQKLITSVLNQTVA